MRPQTAGPTNPSASWDARRRDWSQGLGIAAGNAFVGNGTGRSRRTHHDRPQRVERSTQRRRGRLFLTSVARTRGIFVDTSRVRNSGTPRQSGRTCPRVRNGDRGQRNPLHSYNQACDSVDMPDPSWGGCYSSGSDEGINVVRAPVTWNGSTSGFAKSSKTRPRRTVSSNF